MWLLWITFIATTQIQGAIHHQDYCNRLLNVFHTSTFTLFPYLFSFTRQSDLSKCLLQHSHSKPSNEFPFTQSKIQNLIMACKVLHNWGRGDDYLSDFISTNLLFAQCIYLFLSPCSSCSLPSLLLLQDLWVCLFKIFFWLFAWFTFFHPLGLLSKLTSSNRLLLKTLF